MAAVDAEKNINQMVDPGVYKYWAFLSYSHVDERWASWLHHSLEQYRIPKGLIGRLSAFGPLPNRLFPVFRDREELACASSLNQEIEEALQCARYLIVICSPHSAVSRWVNEEIKAFKKLGRHDRVLAIIVEGEPNATERPDLGLLEAFPEALRFQVDHDGNVTKNRVELIAADARSSCDGKSGALLKLLAGILGVDYDELRQRERRRQIRRRLQFTVAVVVVLAGVIGLWVNRQHALSQQEKIAFAQQLATAAQQGSGASGADLMHQLLLAVESLKRTPTTEGHSALRAAMKLLPHKYAEFPHDGAVEVLYFSPDTLYLAAAAKDEGAGAANDIGPRTVRVWDLASRSEVVRVKLPDYVRNLAISPNRSLLFVSSNDVEVRVWDLKTGQEQSSMIHDRSEMFINAMVLSRDGKLVTTSSGDSLRVWHSQSGQPLFIKRFPGTLGGVAFSPDGSLLAAGQYPNSGQTSSVMLLDLLTGREVFLPQKQPVYSLAFSNDGTWLATGGASAFVWNVKKRSLIREFPQKTENIGFSADGSQLLTANVSYSQLWNFETGMPVNRVDYKGMYGEVNLVTLHPGGTKLATAIGETVSVWDVSKGKEILRLPHNGFVKSVAFSQDGKQIATGSDEGLVRLWSVNPGTAIIIRQDNNLESWQSGEFALSLDGLRMATVGGKMLRVWEMAEGKKVFEKLLGHEANWVVFSPAADLIATDAREDNTVFIFDAATGETKFSLPHADPIWGIEFSLDGKELFTRSGKDIRAWALDTGQEVRHFPHENTVDAYALSPNGTQLASSSGGSTQVWDAKTGASQFQLPYRGAVKSMQFNQDGSFITTVSGSGVRLWDTRNAKLLRILPHDNLVGGVAINPRDNGLLTYSGDQAILWEPGGKKERGRLVHGSEIFGATFDKKGENSVTWGGNTLRIWENKTGKEVAPYNFGDEVKNVAFSHEDQFLIVMHTNGEIDLHLWQVEDLIKEACGRVTRNLTEVEWKMTFNHETYRPTCPGMM